MDRLSVQEMFRASLLTCSHAHLLVYMPQVYAIITQEVTGHVQCRVLYFMKAASTSLSKLPLHIEQVTPCYFLAHERPLIILNVHIMYLSTQDGVISAAVSSSTTQAPPEKQCH